jgi:hypothetical protein
MIAEAGLTFAALFAGHSFGDHWVQSEHQAVCKGGRDWVGRRACLGHVVSLQATKLLALMLAVGLVSLRLNPWWVLAALVVDGASHYWADRRFTLEALAGHVGKRGFYHQGTDLINGEGDSAPHIGTGKYALDQSWHHLWLFVAALIAVQ